MNSETDSNKKSKRTIKVIFSVLKDFAGSSSMDGLRFIANKEASYGERFYLNDFVLPFIFCLNKYIFSNCF